MAWRAGLWLAHMSWILGLGVTLAMTHNTQASGKVTRFARVRADREAEIRREEHILAVGTRRERVQHVYHGQLSAHITFSCITCSMGICELLSIQWDNMRVRRCLFFIRLARSEVLARGQRGRGGKVCDLRCSVLQVMHLPVSLRTPARHGLWLL